MAARDHFRAHARRRVDLAATLRGRDGAFRQEVRIRDLGLGGACIEVSASDEGLLGRTSATPPPGGVGEGRAAQGPGALEREATITIEVMAPTLWDPLILSGRIAWIRRSGQGRGARAGLRFEHREASAIYALFQLLGAQAYDA